jgi:hypothetical protein
MKIYYFAASFHFDIKRKDFPLNVSVKFIPYLLIQKKRRDFSLNVNIKLIPYLMIRKKKKKERFFVELIPYLPILV